jgi:penicillin-binding protein 2
MSLDSPRLRLGVLGVVVASLFAALLARAWYLQVVQAPTARLEANGNRVRTVTIPAPRGRILDRQGRPLVVNQEINAVTVSRAQLSKRSDVLEKLARVLVMPVDELQRKVDDKRFSPYKPVPVAENVPKEKLIYISEHAADFPGVEGVRLTQRAYPQGNLAAHLLGYVAEINDKELAARKNKGYKAGDEIGKSGIEAAYEDDLRGSPGIEQLEVDARGRVLRTIASKLPSTGHDVKLTVDIDIQKLAEDSLDRGLKAARAANDRERKKHFLAPAGSVVVLDPHDGSVLALASNPTYDPAKFIGGITLADFAALQDPAQGSPLTDRATQGQYAPGSTFKLITSVAALRAGVINVNSSYTDTGCYLIGGSKQRVCNALHESHGPVNVTRALTVSSDVFYYHLGDVFWQTRRQNGETPIQDVAHEFGLGKSSGIPVGGESPGLVSTPETRRKLHDKYPKAYPNGQWFAGDNVNLAIGQGELTVTPLQLANAYAAFANGGTLYEPRVADSVIDADGKPVRTFAPKANGHVDLPPNLRDPIMHGLLGVTSDPRGTAAGAFSGFSQAGFQVAGKTGTAQVVNKQDTALFTCFGPFPDARYEVTVVMEEAGFGADAAAPVARRILDVLAGHTPKDIIVTGNPAD